MEFDYDDLLIVTVATMPEPEDMTLNIVDVTVDGKSMIPVYTSEELYEEAMEQEDHDFDAVQVTFGFLFEMMKGDETWIVNPGTDDSYIFNMRDLIQTK